MAKETKEEKKLIPVTDCWDADDVTVDLEKKVVRVHLSNWKNDKEGYYNAKLVGHGVRPDPNEAVFDPNDPERVNIDGLGYSSDYEKMVRYINHSVML